MRPHENGQAETFAGGPTHVGVGQLCNNLPAHMHVLIAEDDRVTGEILARTLQRWNYSTTLVGDGAQAWDRLRVTTDPTLAILDWMMPGMDGPDVCRRVRQELPLANMYMLLVTARESRGDVVAGLDAGADDYIIKPFDPEELRAQRRGRHARARRCSRSSPSASRNCRPRCRTSSSCAACCRSAATASGFAATISTGSRWKGTSPSIPTRSSATASARRATRRSPPRSTSCSATSRRVPNAEPGSGFSPRPATAKTPATISAPPSPTRSTCPCGTPCTRSESSASRSPTAG